MPGKIILELSTSFFAEGSFFVEESFPIAQTVNGSRRNAGQTQTNSPLLQRGYKQKIMNEHKYKKQSLTLAELQRLIDQMYSSRDAARGIDGTFMWLMEEVGELAAVLRDGSRQQRAEEFADVLAWLATIANVAGVDLEQAVLEKYGRGCPGCGEMVCRCDKSEKP